MTEPFNLEVGEPILVKVFAFTNDKEYVLFAKGSGETIKIIPDAPTQLGRDDSISSLISIDKVTNGLKWNPPENNGGSRVIDYKVEFL